MPGANLACLVTTRPGDGVVLHTPVYPPLRRMPEQLERRLIELEFVRDKNGRARFDFDALASALTDSVRLLLLCNPQNPTGRVLEHAELTRLVKECLSREIFICSDEIHADLVHEGATHIPIASLSEEIAQRCITLMSPSKTYNIAGLSCAFAVIQNPTLRAKYRRAQGSLVPHLDILAYPAAIAAYRQGDDWLRQVHRELLSNRNLLHDFVQRELPYVHLARPEGTYLAWLDFRQVMLPRRPFDFFLTEAKVALNDGALFGKSASNCVRLNFGCSESTLREAIRRIADALGRHRVG